MKKTLLTDISNFSNVGGMNPPWVKVLSSRQKKNFITEHIPVRIAAARIWIEDLPEPWTWDDSLPDFTLKFLESSRNYAPPKVSLKLEKLWNPKLNNQVWCMGRGIELGRAISMRWLIEFIGVKQTRKGLPGASFSDPKRPIVDVSIASFLGGSACFDIENRKTDAKALAKMWKACTQAVAHPTIATRHPKMGQKEMAKCFLLIVQHLQEKLYKKRNLANLVKAFQ